MKKIALTSLLAMLAVSGAGAANVIDGNPIYMPKAGHFYSVTSVDTSSNNVDVFDFGEHLGYGIADWWTFEVGTSVTGDDWFNSTQWNDLDINTTIRFVDNTNWKWDLMAGYNVSPILASGGHHFLHGSFMGNEDTEYVWSYGLRAGYTSGALTIAGHAMTDYINTEMFNWRTKGWHMLRAGIDAQYVLSDEWNLVTGAEYQKSLNLYNKELGEWTVTFGANYNIDETKFVGVYVSKDIQHIHDKKIVDGEVQDGYWEIQDGFGIGARFGIDF